MLPLVDVDFQKEVYFNTNIISQTSPCQQTESHGTALSSVCVSVLGEGEEGGGERHKCIKVELI